MRWVRGGPRYGKLSTLTDVVNQIPLILKEGSISPLLSNLLGTPQIDVDGIAIRFENLCGSEDLLGVVSAKLHDQRSVLFTAFLSVQNRETDLSKRLLRRGCEHLNVLGDG